MKKIIFKLFCFILILTVSVSAAPNGANFLKFASGARSVGMGSAFVAAAGGSDALWWNPAALAESAAHKEASLMHNEAGEGIRHQYAAYSQPFSRINGGIGGSISYFSVSDIQGYSPEGVPTKELKAYGLCISAASGVRIIDSFSAGLNLKLIKEHLDTEEALAFGVDVGGLWKTPLNSFVMGFNLQNMGSGLKFIEESSPLPLNLKLGSSYRFRVFGSRILLTGDVNFPSDYPVFFNLGMEYNIFELISLRCGYKSRDDLSNGLRLGGGVRGKNLAFDYAWMPRGIFENSHRISLTLHFGRKYEETGILKNIEQHFESGQKYFYAGKMLSAYREFTYITNIAPRHSAAREYLGHIELSVESAEVSKKIEENFNRGIKYFEEGDIASAAALFNSTLSLNPDHQQAEEYLKEIKERFKEVVESILAKGIEYYDKMEYDNALKEIEKVLALDPENEKAVAYESLIRKKKEKLSKIKEELKEKHLEKIRKRKLLSYIKKGENFYKRKEFKKAIISFKRALKLEPENKDIIKNLTDSHYITGLNLASKDRLLEGAEHFLRCAEYDPLHKESSLAMEKIKVRLKERSREYNRLGLVEYSKRNFKKAIDYWEKAIEFDPEYPAPRENLKRVKKEVP